jgi:NaMN:DMB phosphoribosyltransferase
MIKIYTEKSLGQQWLDRYRGTLPIFSCVLGFTDTGLLPNISAAGATPEARKSTAIADAEYLLHGSQPQPENPLPALVAGASPVLISRAVVQELQIPVYLFNAGLPYVPSNLGAIDLGGTPAQCASSGKALTLSTVQHLLQQGHTWGEKLGKQLAKPLGNSPANYSVNYPVNYSANLINPESSGGAIVNSPNSSSFSSSSGYLILSECVVGGTTTALGILLGLGIDALGKVNSSHPACNHQQKWEVIQAGFRRAGLIDQVNQFNPVMSPLELVAAVGDPMQIVVAGMTLAASRHCGVLLAGGTQMLAVYALARSIAQTQNISWQPEQVVVGTTRWVAEDATGDTVGLAEAIGGVPLVATQLSFAESRYPQLRAYEQGFVKEGVGAGGCAIASHLLADWGQEKLLGSIEAALGG